MSFWADGFQHALEQFEDAKSANDASILISITKDYDPKKEWPKDAT